jgi:DNA-directed RNA polymerase subunit E'/Rpb7
MSNALTNKTKVNYKRKSQYNTKMQNNEIYSQMMITKKIPVHISNIGNNIKETLEKVISSEIDGKCIVEGYIKSKTVEIITFSSGVVRGDYVIFDVVFQCYVCCPVEGMHVKCIAKHINKAGIRAELDETPTPVIIFIARDHNYNVTGFSDVKVDDKIKVRVIGQRFELNDTHISIIAELLETNKTQPHEVSETTIKMGKTPIVDIDLEIEELPVEVEPMKKLSIIVEESLPVKKSGIKKQSVKNRVLKTKKTVKLQ